MTQTSTAPSTLTPEQALNIAATKIANQHPPAKLLSGFMLTLAALDIQDDTNAWAIARETFINVCDGREMRADQEPRTTPTG